MQFAFTEEQNQIREAARVFFEENASAAAVRASIVSELGYDSEQWRRIASEMGWAGTAVAERYGGAGLGLVELSLLQFEHGRRLVPSPFFSTVCLAAPLLAAAGAEPQKQLWLGRIAAGDVRIAVALTGRRGGAGIQGITAQLRRSGDAWRLSGEAGFVIFGHACDMLLVAARDVGAPAKTSTRLVLVNPAAAGVSTERRVMLDLTRPMSSVEFAEIPIERDCVLTVDSACIERALDRARVALAAEAVGGAEYVVEATAKYVKERVQFGRAIGSFQAVKHRLADMMVLLEAAKSACWYAACVADESPGELTVAAAIAKSTCCDAFFECASNSIQLHGGIGFSWEHDAHLYFKRARASSTLLGSPSWQLERIAVSMGLGEPAFTPAY